jgi:hypothetical protein
LDDDEDVEILSSLHEEDEVADLGSLDGEDEVADLGSLDGEEEVNDFGSLGSHDHVHDLGSLDHSHDEVLDFGSDHDMSVLVLQSIDEDDHDVEDLGSVADEAVEVSADEDIAVAHGDAAHSHDDSSSSSSSSSSSESLEILEVEPILVIDPEEPVVLPAEPMIVGGPITIECADGTEHICSSGTQFCYDDTPLLCRVPSANYCEDLNSPDNLFFSY